MYLFLATALDAANHSPEAAAYFWAGVSGGSDTDCRWLHVWRGGRARAADIRAIYAPCVLAVDNSALLEAQATAEAERARRRRAEAEVERMKRIMAAEIMTMRRQMQVIPPVVAPTAIIPSRKATSTRRCEFLGSQLPSKAHGCQWNPWV